MQKASFIIAIEEKNDSLEEVKAWDYFLNAFSSSSVQQTARHRGTLSISSPLVSFAQTWWLIQDQV